MRMPAEMKSTLLVRSLVIVVCFAGGCLSGSVLGSTHDSLFLVLLSYPLARVARSLLIKRKYKDLQGLVMPRFDGSVFFNQRPLQVEFDVAYMALAFGAGATLAKLVLHQRVSYEGLIAIGWGIGDLSASFSFIRRHKSLVR